jgi:IS5 family transposase
MGEVDRLTGEVAGIARQSLQEVQAVARNARWWPGPPAGRWAAGSAGRRTGGDDRRHSAAAFADRPAPCRQPGDPGSAGLALGPDARPIRKGKPRTPTQFGYTLLLAEEERGFVADHQLHKGNPPDAPQLVPAVQRVIGVTGRSPDTVVGDRGFGTGANDQALEALGVKRVGLQRTGTPGKARLALERTRRFRRLRNWRVGIEARISHLKRSFGLRRTRLRRLGGARTWVGLGIFAYNLQRMTVVAS